VKANYSKVDAEDGKENPKTHARLRRMGNSGKSKPAPLNSTRVRHPGTTRERGDNRELRYTLTIYNWSYR
jgi:hypothetical protein